MEHNQTDTAEQSKKTSTSDSVEPRLAFLSEQLVVLQNKYDDIAARLSAIESAQGYPSHHESVETQFDSAEDTQFASVDDDSDDAQAEGIWSWIGSSSLLPSIATTCFILVVALILRTLTDSGMIGMQVGSFVGMGYAVSLLAMGWWLFSRQNRVGAVFPIFGALLMYIILLETHNRYAAVSSLTVYILLFITLLMLYSIGTRFNRPYLSSLGIFCTSFFAISFDFPEPNFLYLMPLLLAANVVAYQFVLKYSSGQWTRWLLFLITAFMLFVWSSKLRLYMGEGQQIPPSFAPLWFLPILSITVIIYILMAARKAFHHEKLGNFDTMLPTANGILIFAVLWPVLTLRPGAIFWLGVSGLVLALLHFLIAYLVLRKGTNAAPGGICAFTFAGTVLLMFAVPLTTDSLLIALPVWSVVAFGLMKMAGVCEIGGIRLASYILQLVACGIGIVLWLEPTQNYAGVFAKIITAGVLMSMSGYQYRWCRNNPPVCSAGFFARFDCNDRIGIVLLFAALVNGFFMLYLMISLLITSVTKEAGYILIGVQSILINSGAIALMFVGLKKRNNEILGAAVGIALLGACKVFASDLFESHGVPLVLSVLSFGAVAASGSFVLRRWLQRPQTNQPAE